MANRMTKVLNKIERRLGLSMLPLPDKLSKDKWAEIIEEDSIPVFSRYFPYLLHVIIDQNCEKDGYYFIDKDVPEGVEILGVKDIDWDAFRTQTYGYGINFNNWDFVYGSYDVTDIALSQANQDLTSMYNLGIYIDFIPPNKIRLVSVNNSPVNRFFPFPLQIYVEHYKNLSTISPTMMTIFEDLCTSDVALWLSQCLKYFDNLDAVFGTVDLKLDAINSWADKRNELIEKLDTEHVSTANEASNLIITV